VPRSDPTLSRRELLAAGAVTAGYALAVRPVRAEAIHTDTAGLEAGMVEVPASDGPIPAYRARPAGGGTRPVVLVVHEIFGVHEYIRDVCRRLAKAGYLALAPDLYHRQGDVSGLASVQEIIERVVMRVPDAQVMADLDATLAYARAHGGDPRLAFVTGFCWGGRIVWMYAGHSPALTAGVAWYGRLAGAPRPETPSQPIDLAVADLPPVLGLYGGQDAGIPLETVHAMRKKLAEGASSSEIAVFPEAPHGFHADYRGSYRQGDAEAGWRRMLAWFRSHGAEVEGK
jgi:carboxymethylenebutenolidase